MPVNTTHPEYDQYIQTWEKMRHVIDGEDAIKKAGIKYLPKPSGMDDADYNGYKERAVYFNAVNRCIDAFSGMVFRKTPVMEYPSQMQGVVDDITLNGIGLVGFCEQVVQEVLEVGRCGVLVDYPIDDGVFRTQAQAQMDGRRAYARLYKAENIINWRLATRGGKQYLEMLVLKETELTQDTQDPFKMVEVDVYRVLEMIDGVYRQTEWVKSKVDYVMRAEIYPKQNGSNLDFIPFTFFGTRDNGVDVCKPVFKDLMLTALAYYRNSADYEHGLHFTGNPQPVVTGISLGGGEELRIGSSSAWVLQNENANAFYMEFKGEGLTSIRQAILDKRQDMAALGARILEADKAAAEASSTLAQRRVGEVSILASIANSVSYGIENVLRDIAFWEGYPVEGIAVSLNTDFVSERLSAQEIQTIVNSWMSGAISKQTMWYMLQQGEVVPDTITYEEEQARLEDGGLDG